MATNEKCDRAGLSIIMGESELELANLKAETVVLPKSFRYAKPHSAYSSTTICQLTMDERIRMKCENREEFLRREATTVKLKVMAETKLDQAIAKLDQTVENRIRSLPSGISTCSFFRYTV